MSSSLRIASFNLENLDLLPGQEAALERRCEILRPQLKRLRADVVCLQEVNGQGGGHHRTRTLRALDVLLDGTDYADFVRISTFSPSSSGPLDRHNLVILSRLPIRSWKQYRHELVQPAVYRVQCADPPESQAQAIRFDRPFLRADLGLQDGRTLHILNVHLRAPIATALAGQKLKSFVWKNSEAWAEGFFLSAVKQVGQALEVRRVVDRLFDENGRALVYVTGDFNGNSQSLAFRIVQAHEEDTGNGLLANRALVSLERSIPESRRFSVWHHGRKDLLDHALISRTLLGHYSSLEIHNETLGDEVVSLEHVQAPPDSFHAPVVAEFSV